MFARVNDPYHIFIPSVRTRVWYHQEKITGQRGKVRALAGICGFHCSYFKTSCTTEAGFLRRPQMFSMTSSEFIGARQRVMAAVEYSEGISLRVYKCLRTSRETDLRRHLLWSVPDLCERPLTRKLARTPKNAR